MECPRSSLRTTRWVPLEGLAADTSKLLPHNFVWLARRLFNGLTICTLTIALPVQESVTWIVPIPLSMGVLTWPLAGSVPEKLSVGGTAEEAGMTRAAKKRAKAANAAVVLRPG